MKNSTPQICAGIVSYNPSIDRLLLSISSLQAQVSKIFIVDNDSQNIDEITQKLADYKQVSVYRNNANLGIAYALNQMCSYAQREKYEWILTLDQDTICPRNLVSLMIPYTNREELGIICPAVNYEGWTCVAKKDISEEYVYACMTSASLTRLTYWSVVGGYRDDFFIDFVDNDYCMKLSLHGYKILRVYGCVINHQLGESGEINLFGIHRIRYSKHSPVRFYYMARNNYVFIKEYKSNINVPKEYCKLLFVISKGIFFSDHKMNSLKLAYRGIKDGKKRKMGVFEA